MVTAGSVPREPELVNAMGTEPELDPEPLPTPPATAFSSLPREQQQPQPHQPPQHSTRNPPTQQGTAQRDPRLRRTLPRLGRNGERWQGRAAPARGGMVGGAAAASAPGGGAPKSRLRLSPGAMPRSLLPVTERKSQEENASGWRSKKSSQDDDKWDMTPDGGSAGREGRQFTVWNVGNNGRIYLRYVTGARKSQVPKQHLSFATAANTRHSWLSLLTDIGRVSDRQTNGTPNRSSCSPRLRRVPQAWMPWQLGSGGGTGIGTIRRHH